MFRNLSLSTRFIPFLAVLILITLLSARKLSDPDLGFHLHGGKWIVENNAIPQKDIGTFTVPDHEYIDLHWIFQVTIYAVYQVSGYQGLSILVVMLSLIIFFLMLHRNNRAGLPPLLSLFLLCIAFLIIEFRIMLRPELFSFIFILVLLILLDNYYTKPFRPKLLYLPALMLLWCNIHSLFILGFFILGAYFISTWVRDRKPDFPFLLWIGLCILVCMINPYGWKALVFPFSLMTRFEPGNIFHGHIREFIPFFGQDKFYIKDYLFILLGLACLILCLVTRKRRKIHEWILLAGFFYLSVKAVRNVPLFVLVAIPILGQAIEEMRERKIPGIMALAKNSKRKVWYPAIFLSLFAVLISIRICTGTFYSGNNSYDKPGLGIDSCQQPVKASEFLLKNRLEGKILNSMPYGGFLSWRLSCPVFIDGRLEVIGEELYKEVTESWNGKLNMLIEKYRPDLVVYNYRKYFPWTAQLIAMEDWRVIYLDGNTAVFVRKGYREDVPEFDYTRLPGMYRIQEYRDRNETIRILQQPLPGRFSNWLSGFWTKKNYSCEQYLNIASFCLQYQELNIAEQFFLENLKLTHGNTMIIYYALADIYRFRGDKMLARICYKKILSFDPENEIVRKSLLNAG